jgi:predicted ATPase/transcriptional regulator with XRE-family HTH domain
LDGPRCTEAEKKVEDYATVTKEVGVNTFGEWLHEQRSLRRLTREELAKRIGCSVSALRKIEYGERRPSAQIAELMANCLDVPPEERSTFVRVARGELSVDRLHPESKPIVSTNNIVLKANLPIFPSPLIGRGREVEHLSQLLRDPQCRLLTFVGPGGIGKTRLAVEAASPTQDFFADGVYFVPLAPVGSPHAVIATIANAIHFAFYGPIDPKVQLLNYLREKQMLLIIDNVEHLLVGEPHEETVVRLSIEILRQAAQVKLLATSRESLGLQDEWVFEVQGLPVPESSYAEGSAENTSVELFLQRARRAHVRFNATLENYPAIVRICQLVDGNPLGIELAAAWVRTLACDEIAQELEQGLDFLTVSARDIPARHRSMRAVFDHSWKLLTEEEQKVLMQLSAFRSGFSREAAEQVAEAMLSALSTLVTKSLIRRSGAGRYDLHELIRQYAEAKQVEHPGELEAAKKRHSTYYADIVQRMHNDLSSARQIDALSKMSTEMNNIRAAWQYAVNNELITAIHNFIRGLWLFYEIRGWFKEGEVTFRWALENVKSWPVPIYNAQPEIAVLREYLRAHYGWFCMRLGQWGDAGRLIQESASQLRGFEARAELADVLHFAGTTLWGIGKYAEARRVLEEKTSLDQQLGNRWGLEMARGQLGLVFQACGDYHQARDLMRSSSKYYQECGDRRMLAVSLFFRAGVEVNLEELNAARELLEESLALSTFVGDRWIMSMSRFQLALVAQAQGGHEQAVRWFNRTLEFCQEMGEHWSKIRALNGLGCSRLALGDDDGAGQAFGEALAAAVEAEIWPDVLEALAGFASLQAKQGNMEHALELLLMILNHPASLQETKTRASNLRADLEAQLTSIQIETIQAHAGEKTLKAVVGDLLR